MKKTVLLISFLFTFFFIQAQNGQITLTFNAEYDGNTVQIDSIKVDNLTQGESTVFYDPEITLTHDPTSIGFVNGVYNELYVSQNFPNPFSSQTNIEIFVPKRDFFHIAIFDLKGRKITGYESYLDFGNHQFTFYACNQQTYIFHVSSQRNMQKRLMIQIGQGNRREARLIYNGINHHTKTEQLKSEPGFIFQIGDELRFTGYSINNLGDLIYDYITDTPAEDKIYLFEMTKADKITGFVQKGPFIIGTQILMSELNASLNQTGMTFSTQIISNSGSFGFDGVVLVSDFVDLSASGYYFNEVTGNLSASPLTLFALSNLTDASSINVNILTHLEKKRVEYLVKQMGFSFTDAKTQAQEEILNIFGIESDDMQNSEYLDIIEDTEANAIMLAIAVILQGNRSVAALTELLATISNDLQVDGVLNNQSIIDNLRQSTLPLNLQNIRNNLETRYESLNTEYTIPDFEYFIEIFLAHTAVEPDASTTPATEITASGALLNGIVNPSSSLTYVIFEYGTTTDYGSVTAADQSPLEGHIDVSVAANIEGLNPGMTYHFRVVAENELGTTYGENMTFTTLGAEPTAQTLEATEITIESAVFHAIVNPNHLETEVSFEYGTTTEYGNTIAAIQSPVDGNADINVIANVEGLNPGMTYHFRVVAENELGITYGENMTFTTLGAEPTAQTLEATEITTESASLNGVVNPNYFTTLVTFEYGTTIEYGNSITAEQSPLEGHTEINVSANIYGLNPGTIYHFRVVAENELGIVYTDNLTLTTTITGIEGVVLDIENNSYQTIGIGYQEWMTDNLRTTKYNDGALIPTGLTNEEWQNTIEGAFSIYPFTLVEGINSLEEMVDKYGILYNWYAVTNENLCPIGWLVPSDEDWNELLEYLINSHGLSNEWDATINGVGNSLKAARQVGHPWGGEYDTNEHPRWNQNDNHYGVDSFGFFALPAGARNPLGNFNWFGSSGNWWSTTEFSSEQAIYYNILSSGGSLIKRNNFNKALGVSVRCIRSPENQTDTYILNLNSNPESAGTLTGSGQ